MHPTGPVRPRAAITAAVTLVVALACLRVLAGGDTFGDERYLLEEAPALGHIGERAADGALPEWWDRVGLGVPFVGNVDHPALYAPAWLMAVAPHRLVTSDLLVVLHLLFLGVGVALLARRFGASDPSSIIAGSAAAVGGSAFGAIGSGSLFALAWCPWIWLAVVALARTGGASRMRWSICLAMLVAAQTTAGAIALVPASVLVGIAIAAHEGRRGAMLHVAAAALAAALLAAAVLVPAAHLRLAPGDQPSWSDAWALLWPAGGGGYVGIPVLVLAALAARDRRGAVLAGSALMLIAAGAMLQPSLLPVAAILVCVAAGLGATHLASDSRWVGLGAAVACAGAAIAVAATARGTDAAALGAAAVVLAAIGAGRWRGSSALTASLGAVVVGHLIAWSWHAVPQIDRAAFDRRPSLLEELESSDGAPPRIARPRVQAPDRNAVLSLVDTLGRAHRTAEANSAVRFGVGYVRGRDRGTSNALARTWSAAAMASGRFLNLYGIEAVAAPSSLSLASGMPVLGEDRAAGVALLGNRQRRPRAFIAPRWRWFAADEDALGEMFPRAMGGDRGLGYATVRLAGVGEDSIVVPGPTPVRPCTIASYRPERVELDCPEDTDGYAVLLDSFEPGWTVEVDGNARSVERADLLARAVRKQSGETRVVFRYRAPGLRAGLLVSALAWGNALIALLVLRRRRSAT